MKVGVLGLGYWGPNLVRNFLSRDEIEKVIGCDQKEERLKFIKMRFPGVEVTNNYANLLNGSVDVSDAFLDSGLTRVYFRVVKWK